MTGMKENKSMRLEQIDRNPWEILTVNLNIVYGRCYGANRSLFCYFGLIFAPNCKKILFYG